MALLPVVGGGLVQLNKLFGCPAFLWVPGCQTHYWALRQQARGTSALVGVAGRESIGPPVWGVGGERFLLLPRFGGGVWCLICG